MKSLLIITSVEDLQKEINASVKLFGNAKGIYVSLNKTEKRIKNIFSQDGIDVKNLFFIDCVGSSKADGRVMQISPTDLDSLSNAISSFVKEIKEKKFLIIDAISTLLIYNDENKVAAFVKDVTKHASENDVEVVAFSPKTKGEELLNKIFNFFDEVKKK
jgi:archaellum biogenesis ATPase FlaH